MNTPAKSVRIQSLDVFRALTMLLMLWVNEYAGVKDLPHWMYHAAAQEDMMGFSDIIFPAFLFAMGMAVPFAVQNRLKKGDSLLQVSLHILLRTVALVVMGLFTVNKGAYDPVASGIPSAWYSLLMVAGFFLVWNLYPKVSDARRYLFAGMKIAGIALLIYLLVIFVPKEGQSFGTKWWGILGLIGWSYLGTSLIYLATRSNLRKAIAAFLLLTACCLLTFAGVFRGTWAEYIPSQPVLYTLSVAGMLAAILLQQYGRRPGSFYGVMVAIGVVMALCGWVAHHWWIISKIQATPTWLFYCCAMFFPAVALLHYLCDVKGKAHWFAIIKPAGTLTLTCYMVPPDRQPDAPVGAPLALVYLQRRGRTGALRAVFPGGHLDRLAAFEDPYPSENLTPSALAEKIRNRDEGSQTPPDPESPGEGEKPTPAFLPE